MIDLRNKRVTVMGLGLHGGAVGTVRWLIGQGARVTVTDLKSAKELEPSLLALRNLDGVRFVLGHHEEADFTETDMVVRNPAVRRDSPLLSAARSAGVPVEMDSSLFWQACPSRDIIGVTGSKGKTTCSRAISSLLSAVHQPVVEVGTDGISPLAELSSITPQTTVVFELSSWRLEALDERHISPPTAVITALFPDHLNTYDSLADYEMAKQTIVRWQRADDIALLNFDDERVRTWDKIVASKRFWFSLGHLAGIGIGIADGWISVQRTGQAERIAPLTALPLHYPHEQRNAMPAILLAHLKGIAIDEIARALSAIQAQPHRLEVIRAVNGVTYINDSAATVPEATAAAIGALSGRAIVLIAGGDDKSLSYHDLAAAIKRPAIRKLILLPGTATEKLRQALTDHRQTPPIVQSGSMAEAVKLAAAAARAGDAVLLSPGATSFGLFQHEFERGDQFREAVRELAVR